MHLSITNWNLSFTYTLVNIQTYYSVMCRSLFGSKCSFESSWISLYKLHTTGFWQFIQFFLTDPSSHWIGFRLGFWTVFEKNCHLQDSPQMFYRVWAWLGQSRTVTSSLLTSIPLFQPLRCTTIAWCCSISLLFWTDVIVLSCLFCLARKYYCCGLQGVSWTSWIGFCPDI